MAGGMEECGKAVRGAKKIRKSISRSALLNFFLRIVWELCGNFVQNLLKLGGIIQNKQNLKSIVSNS